MLERLVGQTTTAAMLKEELDASSQAMRRIAHRVANAGTPDFAEALQDAEAAGQGGIVEEVDLEKEMVSLADEQLRFEASAALLQKTYQQLRSAIRER